MKTSTDALGRISYVYDEVGNVLGVSDEKGTITRTYNARNVGYLYLEFALANNYFK